MLMKTHPLIYYKWEWCVLREHDFYTIDVVWEIDNGDVPTS